MRHRPSLLFAVMLCNAMFGCTEAEGDGELGTSEQAILNGTQTNERPEVGTLTNSGCTATLTAARVILTAAHCVDFQTGPRSDGFLTGTGEFFPIDFVISEGTSAPGWDDLAVARLTSAVPSSIAVPSRVSFAHASFSEVVTAFGYGCTDRANPSVGVGTKRKFVYAFFTNPHLLCPGDSGGPTYHPDGTVFLVNSGYFIADGSDIYANVADNNAWATAAINTLNR